jgi:hypothetical protein
MSGPDRQSCTDAALDRRDPMEGTGSRGMRWFMVELEGGWGHSAFMDSPNVIDPALGRSVVKRAEKAGMRIAAIRRPGPRSSTPRWRWAIADARPGSESLRWGEVDDPRELTEVPLDGSAGTESGDPLVAVCAHGKHDQCCAVRGRRAAAQIAERYPEWTWECSHLGGDRFAATMIVLPHGLYYGRVDGADEPADLVRLFVDGRVDDRFLRGRSSLPEVVQAAQHHARSRTGHDRIDDFTPVSVTPDDTETVVVLDARDGQLTVRIAEEMSQPLLTTCHARVPGRVRQFRLVSIDGV